jgi:outer membrane lipopolysaccharide assembly protein LptE/RlpB
MSKNIAQSIAQRIGKSSDSMSKLSSFLFQKLHTSQVETSDVSNRFCKRGMHLRLINDNIQWLAVVKIVG